MTRALHIGLEIPGGELLSAFGSTSNALGELLDRSGAAYAVIGAERHAQGPGPAPSPTVAGAWLSRRTAKIGLVLAASPQRDHPYNFARRLASVDHLNAGRSGLLVLERDRAVNLGAGDGSSWANVALGAAELADSITAARKLWRTWPAASLDADPDISAAAELRLAAHEGIFSSRGPLNSPSTAQGEPVVFWRVDGLTPGADITALAAADVLVVDATQLDTFLVLAGGLPGSAAASGTPIQLHLRVEAPQLTAESIASWRRHPAVAGLLIAPGAAGLSELVDGRLATLYQAELLQPAGSDATLRGRLNIARRATPDLGNNALAYPLREKEPA